MTSDDQQPFDVSRARDLIEDSQYDNLDRSDRQWVSFTVGV